jgi:hypothetical protein
MIPCRLKAKELIEYFYGKEIEHGINWHLGNDEDFIKAKKQATFCAINMKNIIPDKHYNIKNIALAIDIIDQIKKI